MQIYNVFFNSANRLRSGWRVSIYLLFVILLSVVSDVVLYAIASFVLDGTSRTSWIADLLDVLSRLVLFATAVLAGWTCGRLLEDLPWRALGWSPHKGFMRDLLIGCVVGGASLALAVILAVSFGGLRFSFSSSGALPGVGKTLLVSGFMFAVAAAAEEALFRGYALQTLTRAGLAWLGILLTSVPFAMVHLSNPNVVPRFTFINTALAGVWLAIAYLRTRSLWFPLGVHWAWNWMMAAIFGIPVSGITELTPNPLLRMHDFGPAWLTGGSYGIEGGAACTVALLISTVFIWRTKIISATEEMSALTSHEIPKLTSGAIGLEQS